MIHSEEKQKNTGKLEFLDGIRGLMAINVLLCHFVCVYYPQMYYSEYAQAMGGFLSRFSNTPLSVLVNGNIAVQYFFVLTGFLVGRSFFTKNIPAQAIAKRSVQRYFRLLPVVFAATVFTFLTMRLGLQYHLQINDMVHNTWFLKDYCNFVERLIYLPENIFVNPFVHDGSIFVGPFWTIRYEFWGYIFAMVLCVVFREQKFRHVGYILLWVLLPKTFLSGYNPFLLGVFVADIRFNAAPSALAEITVPKGIHKIIRFVLCLLGLYFSCCPMEFTGIYSNIRTSLTLSTNVVRSIGVAMLMLVLLEAPKVQKFFSHPVLLWMGDRSFEVYAFHWPLMLSFQAWLFYKLSDQFRYDAAAVTAFVATLPVIYLTAHLAHWGLEKAAVLTARYQIKL